MSLWWGQQLPVCGSGGECAVKTVYYAWNHGQLLTAILFRPAECGRKPPKKTANSQISGKIREKTSYFGWHDLFLIIYNVAVSKISGCIKLIRHNSVENPTKYESFRHLLLVLKVMWRSTHFSEVGDSFNDTNIAQMSSVDLALLMWTEFEKCKSNYGGPSSISNQLFAALRWSYSPNFTKKIHGYDFLEILLTGKQKKKNWQVPSI